MSAARSGIGWMIANVGALGVAWAATAYFTRALTSPQATLGQFAVFETIVSFGLLISMGGTSASITKYLSGTSIAAVRNRFFAAGLAIGTGRLAFVLLVTLLSLPLYVDLFADGTTIGLLAAGLVAMLTIQRLAHSALKGLSYVGRVGFFALIDALSRAAAQIALVFAGFGLVGLTGGALIGTSIATLVALGFLTGRIGLAQPTRDEIIAVLRFTKDTATSGIATKFYDNIDIIVIRWFIGDEATGMYSIGYRFALPIQVVSGAIGNTMFPEVSKESSKANRKRVVELVSDGLVYATIIALPATVGVAILAQPLITTLYTGAFTNSAIIAAVAVAIQIPDGFRSVLTTGLNAIDRPDLPARAGVVLITVNAILDLLLVPTAGPLGAIVASFIGVSASTGYLAYHTYNALSLTFMNLPFQEFGSEVASALVMGGIVFWMRESLAVSNIWLLTITVPTGVVVYFGMLLSISSGIRQRVLGVLNDIVPI